MVASQTEDLEILVVDDDQGIRSTLEQALQQYHVAVAADGEEALSWLRSHRAPGLILLDLMMPIMDGWEVLGELRADERLSRVPVVVVTAFQRDLGTAAELPILRKPFELRTLRSVVERYVGGNG